MGRAYNLQNPVNLSPYEGKATSHWFWGALNTSVPVTGSVSLLIVPMGYMARFTFTLALASVPVVDAGAGGSSGTYKLFDFNEMGLAFHGCRQDYTATVEGSALTTGAGDAVYVWGIGTTSATTARDGTLTGDEQNVGTLTGAITNVAGTGAGTKLNGAVVAAIDGTTTASDLWLNWSGTAATIDANSTIAVTGTVSVLVASLSDD